MERWPRSSLDTPLPRYRQVAAATGIVATLTMLAAHLVALAQSGTNAVVTPISTLSRGPGEHLHTAGLLAFALAHFALAWTLRGFDRGWLWRVGLVLIALSGLGLGGIAAYFAAAPEAMLTGPDANDPLSVLASTIGLAMGALHLGLRRHAPTMQRFNAFCLTLWLLLIPLILLVNDRWLGGYERLVGAIYVLWVSGMCGLWLAHQRAARIER